MKPRLVILDADAVIHLSELGKWEAILNCFEVILPDIVAEQEVKYFDDGRGVKKSIRIKEFFQRGLLQIESANLSEITHVRTQLGKAFHANYEVHAGELEAMAVLLRHLDCGTAICTGDTAAVIALCCLQLSEKVVSLESLLSSCGHSAEVRYNFSEEALKNKIKTGSVFNIQYGAL